MLSHNVWVNATNVLRSVVGLPQLSESAANRVGE